MSRDLREFMITSIISFMIYRQNVRSLGRTWLDRMNDDEVKQKYDEIVNEV